MSTVLQTTDFLCGQCPDSRCTATKVREDNGREHIVIAHEAPSCSSYRNLNVAEFMRAAMERRHADAAERAAVPPGCGDA